MSTLNPGAQASKPPRPDGQFVLQEDFNYPIAVGQAAEIIDALIAERHKLELLLKQERESRIVIDDLLHDLSNLLDIDFTGVAV